MSERGMISRRSLHGELVDLLHDMVLEGELRPGDKVNEVALCARFGVSRTPLREALKVLASGGLVILSPNRGASVAQISPEEIDQLFPIMEALAGELACGRITDEGVARIRKTHDQMVRHYEKREHTPFLKLNRTIHEAIFEAAGNAELTQFYHTLMVRTHAVRFTAKKSPSRWSEAVADHVQMMDALEKRDGKRLAAILQSHLRHKAAMVHESIAESSSAAAE